MGLSLNSEVGKNSSCWIDGHPSCEMSLLATPPGGSIQGCKKSNRSGGCLGERQWRRQKSWKGDNTRVPCLSPFRLAAPPPGVSAAVESHESANLSKCKRHLVKTLALKTKGGGVGEGGEEGATSKASSVGGDIIGGLYLTVHATRARQALLPSTASQSSVNFMLVASMTLSNHLIL